MLEAALIREMDNNSWNVARIEKLTELGLSLDSNAELSAAYRFRRARARLSNGQKIKEAEAELRDVGDGKTDVADDALYALAERRENEAKYVEALEIYDSVVKRFSPTTSNMRSSAESRATNIRRPSLSISVPNNELPGVRPQIYANYRNVKNATWTLKRADPLSLPQGSWPADPQNFGGATVKTWNTTLEAPSKYAPGNTNFNLEATEPGLYVITVTADGQSSQAWALISQHVVVAKTDRTQVVVACFDVETGEAQPDADVALYLYRSGGSHQKLTGKTNASGIATFKTENTHDSMVVWTKKGPHIAWSSAGGSYWQNYNREHLAYVMTDRPLYKPGETVGLKLYLRSREGGPSTPISGQKAYVRVNDPNGKQLVRETVTTNAFGTASFTLTLDKKVTLGAFSITVETDGQYFTQPSMQFRVEEYKPPEYIVSRRGDRQPEARRQGEVQGEGRLLLGRRGRERHRARAGHREGLAAPVRRVARRSGRGGAEQRLRRRRGLPLPPRTRALPALVRAVRGAHAAVQDGLRRHRRGGGPGVPGWEPVTRVRGAGASSPTARAGRSPAAGRSSSPPRRSSST